MYVCINEWTVCEQVGAVMDPLLLLLLLLLLSLFGSKLIKHTLGALEEKFREKDYVLGAKLVWW